MLGNDWDIILDDMFKSNEFIDFYSMIKREYESNIIYPEFTNIFNFLKKTSYEKVKVVIVGQDPYHGENEAQGLSFSVKEGIKLPPSLKNIYKEIYNDLEIKEPNNGDLTKWAKQGVLLLNSTLTVIKDKPNSHSKIGWERYTDYIIKKVEK